MPPRSTRRGPTREAAAASIDDELEARQVTRVLCEQAARAAADIALLVADAERRTFENRQHRESIVIEEVTVTEKVTRRSASR